MRSKWNFTLEQFSISFRKYFHIDNKDVKFPFDDHCFSLMIQYKFEFAMEGGRTDTLRTGLSHSGSREFVTLWHSALPQLRVKSKEGSQCPPPVARPLPLPLFAVCQPWHRQTDTDWQTNSANVKQGLAKAALKLWTEVCFSVWCSNCDFKKSKKQNVINY